MGRNSMKFMRLPGGASGAILRIVLGAFIGGSVALVFGLWFAMTPQRELGSLMEFTWLILRFSVPIGSCAGGFAGVVVAAICADDPGTGPFDEPKFLKHPGPPYVDDFDL
jgi:hypothetical protein